MFRLWDIAIAPALAAVGARRVVHIGALTDARRSLLLELLGAQGELHEIDPAADPGERRAGAVGPLVIHGSHSLDVLATIPSADAVLIDGDHNWYTVSRELQIIAEAALAAGRPLPLLILHDVCWPYGRRDLYEELSRIPDEFRQPYARGGVRPGRTELAAGAGLNPTRFHAEHEGGPRNGVMTAVEDFVACGSGLRQVVLPVDFGLAMVVDEARARLTPKIAAVFDRFESASGREEQARLTENLRADTVVAGADRVRALERRVKTEMTRYLELLKSALLDEHYLENEVRIEYLTGLPPGAEPDLSALRDPARYIPVRYDRLEQARRAGWTTSGGQNLTHLSYAAMGRPQLEYLEGALTALSAAHVPGDLAEIGVGRGGGAIFMRGFLEAHQLPDRQVCVADRFLGSEPSAPNGAEGLPEKLTRFAAELNQVRDGFARFDLLDDRVRFLQGLPEHAVRDAPIEHLALVRLGRTLGASLGPVLDQVYPRMSAGGVVIVDGTADAGVFEVVEEARTRLGITEPIERVDWNSVAWRVAAAPAARASAPVLAANESGGDSVPLRVPLLSPTGAGRVALSVIVVFYNMRREADRTLRSLSRSYQRGLESLDYEVIVVDNGSDADQRLDESYVTSFGAEFRFLDIGDDARPSPTAALNRGAAVARGDVLAFMIDGAHVLTPGVLRLGMTAISTYAPAIVATQQWYLGPGQQGDALHAGYDQAAEDRLFARINWPVDGYRLFEIGHFIGERDWFDGIVESNCLFVPRPLLEQAGGFDDNFSMPGGGYANLDLYERLGSSPGVNVASLLGEGTFHQVHGGTTTNVADAAVRRDLVASYREHFDELRGRGLVGLTKPVYFVGAMATKAARRTRSRHELSLAFDPRRDPVKGRAPESTPVPDELKRAAIEAMWHNGAWRDTTWLGHRVARLPTDLYSYQELLTQVRPGVVIVAGNDEGLGGRALFAASICDQLDHGRVIAVGGSEAGEVPGHKRLVRVVGEPEDPAIATEVRGLLGEQADALVFLALGAVERVIGAFELYAPFVPVDSYVVVENTVVNGRPVESSFGPGPFEAVVNILGRHREFMADPTFERHTLTFNKGGFLRRVSPTPA
jgi:cephalosporin hydroxylase